MENLLAITKLVATIVIGISLIAYFIKVMFYSNTTKVSPKPMSPITRYSWIIMASCGVLSLLCALILEPEVSIKDSEFMYLSGLFAISALHFYSKRKNEAQQQYKIDQKIHYVTHDTNEIFMGVILDCAWNNIKSEHEYLIEDRTRSPYVRQWILERFILDNKVEKYWNVMTRNKRESLFADFMKIIKPHKKYRKQTPEAKAIILRQYNKH